MLSLEGFQAGLSWLTILRKRDNFRRAFAGWQPAVVADFGAVDVERLLADPGIVRHRGKIEAAIGNARALQALTAGSTFAGYLAAQVPPPPRRQPAGAGPADLPASTPASLSLSLSRDLRRHGFRFVGPTTIYAFMQAVGLVDDHLPSCFRYVGAA